MKIVILSDSEGRTIKRYRETQRRILLSRGGQFSRRYLKEDSGVIRFDGCAVMSHPHATLSFFGDTVWITDRNSRNGTCVNGEEIYAPTELKDGDTLTLGKEVVIHGQEITPAPLTVQIEDDGVIPAPIEAIVIVSEDESVSSINDSFFENDDDCSIHASEAPLPVISTDERPEQPYYIVQSMHKEWEQVSQRERTQEEVLDPSDAMARVEKGGAVSSYDHESGNEGTLSHLPSVEEWRNNTTQASHSHGHTSLPSIQTRDVSCPPISTLIIDPPLSEISEVSRVHHDDRLSAGTITSQIISISSPSYDVTIDERDVISRDHCFASARPDVIRAETSAVNGSDFSTETEVAVGRCSCMTCSGYYQRVVKADDSEMERQTADSVSDIEHDDEVTCLYNGLDVTQKVPIGICYSNEAEMLEESKPAPGRMSQEASAALQDLERIKTYPVSTRYAEQQASHTGAISHASSKPFSRVPVFAPFDPEKFASVSQKPTLMDFLSEQLPAKVESGDEMSELSQADSEYDLTSASDDRSIDDVDSVVGHKLSADYEEPSGVPSESESEDDLDNATQIEDEKDSDVADDVEEDLDNDLEGDIDGGLYQPIQDVCEVSFDSDMDIECDEEQPVKLVTPVSYRENELHAPGESGTIAASSTAQHISSCDDISREMTEEESESLSLSPPTDTDKAIALLLSNGLGRSVSDIMADNKSIDSAVAAYSLEEDEVSGDVAHVEDEIFSLNSPDLEYWENSFASESDGESSQHTYSEVEDSKLYDSGDLSEDHPEDDSDISSGTDSTFRYEISADELEIMWEESVSESGEEDHDKSESESEEEGSINIIEEKKDYWAAVREAVREENANREEYEAYKRDPTLPKPVYIYRKVRPRSNAAETLTRFYRFLDEESEAKFTGSEGTGSSDCESDSDIADDSDGVSDLMLRFYMPKKEQPVCDTECISESFSAYEEEGSEEERLFARLSEDEGCVTEDEFMQDISMIEREEASDSEVYDPVEIHMANKKNMENRNMDEMLNKINTCILEIREDCRKLDESTQKMKEERQRRLETLSEAKGTATLPFFDQCVQYSETSCASSEDGDGDRAADSSSCELQREVIIDAPGANAAVSNSTENSRLSDRDTDNIKKEDTLNSHNRMNSTIGEPTVGDIYHGVLPKTTSPSMALNTATTLSEILPVWSFVDSGSEEQSVPYSIDAAYASGVSQKLTPCLASGRARVTETSAKVATLDLVDLPATVPGQKRSRDQVARDDADADADADATPEVAVHDSERAATRRRLSLAYALNAVRPIVASIRKPVVSSVGLGLGVVLVANAVDALL